jgi:FkbM family methyltransferase
MNSKRVADTWRVLKRCWRTARGKEIFPALQVQCRTLTLGNRGAAWSFCPEGLTAASVAYSFGVGEEISFDRELIDRFRMTVHAFDPTPRSVAWVRRQSLPDQFVFHGYGVAAEDSLRRFNPPQNALHVSHTLLERASERNSEHNSERNSERDWAGDGPGTAIEVPVRRLSSIMRTLGHSRIDLLKMDIEGAEYEVIEDLVGSDIAVGQLLIEFHHRWPEVGIAKTKNAIRQLNRAGYRIFGSSASGEEYGFLKISAPLPENRETHAPAVASPNHDL